MQACLNKPQPIPTKDATIGMPLNPTFFISLLIHPWKTNMCPYKAAFQKERIIFQPLIFGRGHVSFRGIKSFRSGVSCENLVSLTKHLKSQFPASISWPRDLSSWQEMHLKAQYSLRWWWKNLENNRKLWGKYLKTGEIVVEPWFNLSLL